MKQAAVLSSSSSDQSWVLGEHQLTSLAACCCWPPGLHHASIYVHYIVLYNGSCRRLRHTRVVSYCFFCSRPKRYRRQDLRWPCAPASIASESSIVAAICHARPRDQIKVGSYATTEPPTWKQGEYKRKEKLELTAWSVLFHSRHPPFSDLSRGSEPAQLVRIEDVIVHHSISYLNSNTYLYLYFFFFN
jgi:hypothetical protein